MPGVDPRLHSLSEFNFSLLIRKGLGLFLQLLHYMPWHTVRHAKSHVLYLLVSVEMRQIPPAVPPPTTTISGHAGTANLLIGILHTNSLRPASIRKLTVPGLPFTMLLLRRRVPELL